MSEEETVAKEDVAGKAGNGLPLILQIESLLWKLKKCLDRLVDLYCGLTRIEPVEAKDMLSRKAAALMKKGQYGKAIDQYNRLIRMGKEEAEIYYRLGLCCEREGLDEEAEKAHKKAAELDGNLGDAFYRLGLLAINNDDPQAAVKYLSELARKENGSFDVLYNLGVAYDKARDYDMAAATLRKAIAAEPHYAKAHKRLGYVYAAAGKHEDANDCFKKAMELEEV
jgi:Flp pilus assembly protein TadD